MGPYIIILCWLVLLTIFAVVAIATISPISLYIYNYIENDDSLYVGFIKLWMTGLESSGRSLLHLWFIHTYMYA